MKHPAQRSLPSQLAHSLALLTLLTALASAQRTAHVSAPHPHFNQSAGNFAFRQNARPYGFHQSPRTSLPFPFFGDFLDADDLYSTGYPVASQPPILLLQATRALAGSSDLAQPRNDRERLPSTQPLMIELQNGRYVRISGTAANGEPLPIESTHPQLNNTKPPLTAETRPDNLAPAVLVFRDGHTEEVRDYAIADGILYARSDYYTDGYWNKKINLATLNLAETLQANNQRNVKFILPSSPNEVITRP